MYFGKESRDYCKASHRTWFIVKPPFDIYVGKPDIRPRDVIKSFWEWNYPELIYIPIDMSHSLGAPALLNFTFDNNKSFEEEVQRIKTNQDDYIAQQDRWITILRNEQCDDIFCMHFYDYDRSNLQGLAISQTANASYFTFSFWADPAMKTKYLEKYGLSLLNI